MNFMVVLTLTGFLAVCWAEYSTTILTPTYTDESRAQRSVQSQDHGHFFHKRDIQTTPGMERQERSAPTTEQPMKREVPNSTEHPHQNKRQAPNVSEIPNRARRQASTPPSVV